MEVEILELIKENTDIDLQIVKELESKPTARANKHILCKSGKANYILVISKNNISNFYLKRSHLFQSEFFKYESSFLLNTPLYSGDFNGNNFALFNYFKNHKFCNDNQPLEILNNLYELEAKTFNINAEILEKIENCFLAAWPEDFHFEIKNLELYRAYFEELGKLEEVRLFFEHGDFTTNNIIKIKKDIYLLDFEFSRNFQPIGFDLYDYNKSPKSKLKIKDKVFMYFKIFLNRLELSQESLSKPFTYYENLHKIKYELINQINDIIDNQTTGLLS